MPTDTEHGATNRGPNLLADIEPHHRTQHGANCGAQRNAERRALGVANCGAEHRSAERNAQRGANLWSANNRAELRAERGADSFAHGPTERTPDAWPDRVANHHGANPAGGNLCAHRRADNHRADPGSVRGADHSPSHLRTHRCADGATDHPDANGRAVYSADGVHTERGAGDVRTERGAGNEADCGPHRRPVFESNWRAIPIANRCAERWSDRRSDAHAAGIGSPDPVPPAIQVHVRPCRPQHDVNVHSYRPAARLRPLRWSGCRWDLRGGEL